MRFEKKQRIVFAVLVVLAIWPLVHRGFVDRYDLNPWKFFGWSMYCTQFRDDFEIVMDPWIDREKDRRWERPIRKLKANSRSFGTLYSAESFCREMMGLYPEIRSISVETQRTYLDAKTGRLRRGPVRRVDVVIE